MTLSKTIHLGFGSRFFVRVVLFFCLMVLVLLGFFFFLIQAQQDFENLRLRQIKEYESTDNQLKVDKSLIYQWPYRHSSTSAPGCPRKPGMPSPVLGHPPRVGSQPWFQGTAPQSPYSAHFCPCWSHKLQQFWLTAGWKQYWQFINLIFHPT